MPLKIARSAARPSFGLPELLVAIHTSRQSCSKAGKAQMFALVWESSGESRLIYSSRPTTHARGRFQLKSFLILHKPTSTIYR